MAQPYMLLPPSGSEASDEWVKLGIEAQLAGKLSDAERHYRQALRLNPKHLVATQNFAILYAQANNLTEATLTMERAALMDGVCDAISMNRALMYLEADRIDEALKSAELAHRQKPSLHTRLTLATIYATAGQPEQAVPLYNEMLDEDSKHAQAGANSCFVQTLTDATPADLLKQRQRWYQAHRYTGEKRAHANEKSLDRPLRVGYVSGDYKYHSASMIFSAVLFHHDPMQVELYLYSTLPVDPVADGQTKKFQEMAGPRWRDISLVDDEKADALIQQDQIDILVDLAAHTNGGRLALFTRKPAPIQVTAWGFAHGTGCPELDYFFADPVAIPHGERQHYAEQIVDLPCIVSYEPPFDGLRESSPLPSASNGYVTFGSSARYEKLSAECLQTFAEILRRVPESRLYLKDHSYRRPYSIQRVLHALDGIDPARVDFAISTTHPEHLQSYQQIDLILDPFPHTGGVVGLEQLYMGVPVLTRYGTQAAGRTTASILTAMGRTGWIAKTSAEYIEKAVALADDPKSLASSRKTLRRELMQSPVVKDYPRAVEAAYRTIWHTWCKN